MRAVDSRTKVTKNKIASSYIELLKTKRYLCITAKDVYTNAGIHKTTFYRHFHALNEIEDYIEQTVLIVFEKILGSVSLDDFLKGRQSFLKLVKDTVKSNKEFYSNVLVLNQNVSFLERINRSIETRLKDILKGHTEIDDNQIEIIFTYAVGGRIAVFRKWILGDFAIPESVISEVLEQMSETGLYSFIN